MERTRTTALSVSMILIMIGLMLLPAAMGSTGNVDNYSVVVSSSQNTALSTSDVSFAETLAGASDTITGSFTLNNTGNIAATVAAQFTTNGTGAAAATYGMIGATTTNAIPGTSFSLNNTNGATPAWVALKATAEDQATGTSQNVLADSAIDTWDAKISVPAGQATDTYTGTVQLTFSN